MEDQDQIDNQENNDKRPDEGGESNVAAEKKAELAEQLEDKKPLPKKKKSARKKTAVKKKAIKKVDADKIKERKKASSTLKDKQDPEPDLFEDHLDDDWIDEGGEGSGAKDIFDGVGSLIGGWRSLSSSALRIAKEKTVDSAAKMISQSPDQLERMAKAGRSLQDLRSVAGVSVEELANAIDLKNPDLLKAVEEGKAALPFEIILRLSSFYARNNPIPFILNYARTYNPLISNTLEKIGIDKLVISAEREMQFVQILRSRDEARELSDEDFKRVHAFTEKAFDMALNFAAGKDKADDED